MALVTLADLFFRFSALGLLIALVLFNWPRLTHFERLLSVALATSLACFVLLTQPLPEWRFNPLRNLFLAGTELLPLILCACAWYLITLRIPHWLTLSWGRWLLGCAVLASSSVFLVYGGNTHWHTLMHLFSAFAMCAALYYCLANFNDDLVHSRRRMRLILAAFALLHCLVLVGFELSDSLIRRDPIYLLANVVFIFCLLLLLTGLSRPAVRGNGNPSQAAQQTLPVPAHWLTTYEALQTLLAQGIYREPELTIGLLAERLDIPTHQLRTLINQQLGCKNFSHFINQYRLTYAAEQLRDLAHARTAILSIAYDAGFNSIGPFNRAFKQAYALTPGDYRRQHLSAVQSSSKDCTGS
ncbi:helix-turn-helix domain-containing protein [Pseudoalteromonas sp. DL2-H2.2]|uniref:AraC family transcriptional regulator n=1 Tax=Pseudoalteromonas sp. DL2-H2.2 TaxID=2908889 RepID=UPI001F4543BC|nr:helix-turn-helix domain-containing protein [Pseudoalteromonas sp. DL2-H2.2]MCF2910411.1 helix-turn-helix domain-containing protein [Pseudoalteromonas sp. DL2-H2.2]